MHRAGDPADAASLSHCRRAYYALLERFLKRPPGSALIKKADGIGAATRYRIASCISGSAPRALSAQSHEPLFAFSTLFVTSKENGGSFFFPSPALPPDSARLPQEEL